jgi:uncharacterized membrane protein
MSTTVIWLGVLASISFWTLPAMRSSLSAEDFVIWIRKTNKRFIPLSWFSIAMLTATGLIQMGANPNYSGYLSIANNWAIALLLKHIIFIGMIVVSAYISWFIHPNLERAAILRAAGRDSGNEIHIANRLQKMVRLNMILGLLTLAFTAYARIS